MKKILIAYDGTEPARQALETAAQLAKALDAKVAVISVVPRRPGRFPSDPWDDREVHATELTEARRILADQGIDAELIEPSGDPAHEIERVAEAGGFDTIVVGARPLGELSRILAGSVSEHVATHARATVIVAR